MRARRKAKKAGAKRAHDRGVNYVVIAALAIFLIAAAGLGSRDNRPNSEMLAGEGGLEVTSGELSYFGGAKGFLARPSEGGDYPGVVMVHEWWGLNGNVRDMARQLASEGYVVLAVDLYEGKVAGTPDEARALVTSLDKERATENMRAAVSYLRDEQGATRMASLGWCFGGGQSLQLALSGEELDATVIYYGTLVTDEAQLASIGWPVLGVFGDRDTSIPVETVREFDSALDGLGIENEVYVYEGVGHAFANPSGGNYAPDETRDAWEKTLSFLDRHLKGAK